MVPGTKVKGACLTPCFLLPPSSKFGENLFSCEEASGAQASDWWMVAGGWYSLCSCGAKDCLTTQKTQKIFQHGQEA